MKPIKMTKEAEERMLTSFFEKFRKEWETFKENLNDVKFSFSTDLSEVAKEKILIIYSQKAYLRMQALVDFYDTEVGWYGLVERVTDKIFRVYDVKLCKQYVNGAKVDTEDEDTLEFFNSLTDDEAEHLHFQAHSHVKMSTGASGVDLQNQADVVKNMGNSGFYIFQIWNKNNDINTYLYDLDNNVFYDRKDIVLDIEDEDALISDFLDSTTDMVVEMKYQYQKKQGKKEEPAYLNGYYGGNVYPYDERFDY